MARIEVDVDIDIEDYLHEVDTDDLIDELASRSLDYSEQSKINRVFNFSKSTGKTTILDELKTEVVMSGFKEKTLQELEIFFK